MNEIEKTGMLGALADAKCGLDHGPAAKPPPASDWLTVPVNGAEGSQQELTIPVCAECARELSLPVGASAWVLVYCLNCNASHWIHRGLAKLDYTSHVTSNPLRLIWLTGCHLCLASGKKGGFYPTSYAGEQTEEPQNAS